MVLENSDFTKRSSFGGEAASLGFLALFFSVAIAISIKEQKQKYEYEEQYFTIVPEKSKAFSF